MPPHFSAILAGNFHPFPLSPSSLPLTLKPAHLPYFPSHSNPHISLTAPAHFPSPYRTPNALIVRD